MTKQETATETLLRYVPAGPTRDELLELVRTGAKFLQQQHIGRRPGFLRRYVTNIVALLDSPTFENLIDELELEAARRGFSETSKGRPPIEEVNRIWDLVKYHDPKRGEVQVTFGRLRNILTSAKKSLFMGSLIP